MPNGKVGDDWYTDVVVHERPAFTPQIDAAIREIAGGRGEPLFHPLIELVDQHISDGMWENMTPDQHRALQGDLNEMLRRIRSL